MSNEEEQVTLPMFCAFRAGAFYNDIYNNVWMRGVDAGDDDAVVVGEGPSVPFALLVPSAGNEAPSVHEFLPRLSVAGIVP